MTRLARIVAVLVLAMVPCILATAPASAGVQDFTITSFTSEYHLDRDANQRSTLHTVETIVATFPSVDQNHGIYRSLADAGAASSIEVESVTDENGAPWLYESDSDDDLLVLQIGDGDRYLHGTQTFVITYTRQNVISFTAGAEDFYWDTSGTGWPQAIGSHTTRVHIPTDLATALSGDVACYRGPEGSTLGCDEPLITNSGSDVVYEFTESAIGSFETVTIAIGFNDGTFGDQSSLPCVTRCVGRGSAGAHPHGRATVRGSRRRSRRVPAAP